MVNKKRYNPKTLPYNISIDSAILFYENELYKINQYINKTKFHKEYERLMTYRTVCQRTLEALKTQKDYGVKKVNVIQ